jgi:RNA-binding protein FUS
MAYNPDTMSFEVPHTDTVYVTGLPPNITEDDVADFFGSIGVIKIDKKTRGKKIWLYRDKATGQLKGDGTVSYDDPFSAGSAVAWFHDKEWKGGCCPPPGAHSSAACARTDCMHVDIQHC